MKKERTPTWTLSVRIPLSYMEALEEAASKQGITVSELVRRLIEKELGLRPPQASRGSGEKAAKRTEEAPRGAAKPPEKTAPPVAPPPPAPKASDAEELAEDARVLAEELESFLPEIDRAVKSIGDDALARKALLTGAKGYEQAGQRARLALFKAEAALSEDIPRIEEELSRLAGRVPPEKLEEIRRSLDRARRIAELYVGFFRRGDAWLPPKPE